MLHPADFTMQEPPEDNFKNGRYNGSYTVPWPLSQSNPWN